MREQTLIIDPDDARDAVLEGLASIERGDFIELKGEAALKEFFADIVARGRKRLAAKRGSFRPDVRKCPTDAVAAIRQSKTMSGALALRA